VSRKDRIKKLEGILVDPDRRCRKQVVSVGSTQSAAYEPITQFLLLRLHRLQSRFLPRPDLRFSILIRRASLQRLLLW